MFTYNNEELIQIVNENLAELDEDVKCRLRVICKIAIMMRKFEKSASENFKNSLTYIFDKEQAISHHLNEKGSDSEQRANLIYFIRKFDLDWNHMKSIFTNFDFREEAIKYLKRFQQQNQTDADLECAYLTSLAIKYLCRNSCKTMSNLTSVLDPLLVLDLLSTLTDDGIKTQLVWTLGYIIQSCTLSRDNGSNKTFW